MEQNLYFIISCSKSFAPNIQKNISIIYGKKKVIPEIVDIDVKGLIDSLNNKNIYLYKSKLIPAKDNGDNKITIYIDNLNLNKCKLKCPLNSKNGVKNYFIYSTKFDYDYKISESIFNYFFGESKDKNVEDFVNNKFDIENYQKFLIFKAYLKQNEKSDYIDDLLNYTIQDIYNINNYEFILILLIDLVKFEKDYLKINHQLFEKFISSFNNIYIDIKQYENEEYYKIISIIEGYRVNLEQKLKLLLNLDIIILLFYQINIRKEFKIFFNKIKSKKEVVHFILKNRKIFYAYDCDEMEIIYTNGFNIKINDVISLSSNFNEYIKFYIKMYENDNKRNEILRVDLTKMPEISENYEFNYLKKFVDITIDDNEIEYFPYEKYIELINKLNDYEKLLELKSIFLNKNWKSYKINSNLRNKIHKIGKLYIEKDKLDNIQIIKFIQNDAKSYSKEYENNPEYARLIGHINLNEINEDFKNQFNYNNYNYEKLIKKN